MLCLQGGITNQKLGAAGLTRRGAEAKKKQLKGAAGCEYGNQKIAGEKKY